MMIFIQIFLCANAGREYPIMADIKEIVTKADHGPMVKVQRQIDVFCTSQMLSGSRDSFLFPQFCVSRIVTLLAFKKTRLDEHWHEADQKADPEISSGSIFGK